MSDAGVSKGTARYWLKKAVREGRLREVCQRPCHCFSEYEYVPVFDVPEYAAPAVARIYALASGQEHERSGASQSLLTSERA